MDNLTKRQSRKLIKNMLAITGTYDNMALELGLNSRQVPHNWYRRGKIPALQVNAIIAKLGAEYEQ